MIRDYIIFIILLV